MKDAVMMLLVTVVVTVVTTVVVVGALDIFVELEFLL